MRFDDLCSTVVAAVVQEAAVDDLDAPIARFGMRDVPMPDRDTLERIVVQDRTDPGKGGGVSVMRGAPPHVNIGRNSRMVASWKFR